MVEAEKTLQRLSGKVSKLNQDSDEINKMISSFEKRLEEMNVGVTAWVNDPDIEMFNENKFVLGASSQSKGESEEIAATLLGYHKIDGCWRIAAKTIIVIERPHPTDPDDCLQACETTSIIPLVDASRDYRVKALAGMDELFKAIEQKVDDLLKAIEQGKKFAKTL